jgi:TolA-binding protein
MSTIRLPENLSQQTRRNILALLLLVALASITQKAGADDTQARADKLFETAMAAFKLERYEDCANKFYDFMAVAPYDPRNDEAQYYVGRSFMHRNYLNRAIEEFSYLIEDFPNSQYASLGLYDRAQSCLQTRQQDKAVADMEALIQRAVTIYHGKEDPMKAQLYVNHRDAVFWLAKYYLDKNEHDKAIAAYQKLPNPLEAFRHVVNVYYGLQQYDKIRELIDGLQSENRHEGFKYLIEFYGKRKAVNQLKSIFSKLLEEKQPTNATDDLVWHTAESFQNVSVEHWDWAMHQVSANYGRMARRADYRLAERHWQNAAYLDDLELFVIKYRNGNDVDTVLRWKGITLERTGKPEEARKTYRRISDAGLGHWYAAETWHGSYAKEKNIDAAIEEYVALRTAFYALDWSAMAQWRIADLYRAQNKTDDAVEAYRHVAERFTNLVIDQGHFAELQKRFFNIPKRYYGSAARLAGGDTLRNAGRFDDAEMEYRIVVMQFPKSEEAPVAAYRTALCYEGREDIETAIRILKNVMQRYPKTAAASDAHTRLETKYDIPDTQVTDALDFFVETEDSTKNYMEDPNKLKRKQ